jgi:4-amino-4-deoxychorismate lyase
MPAVADWVDGRAATAAELGALAGCNYGHFTTLQVRGGAVQGLALHLARLEAASRELFHVQPCAGRIRREMRAALDADGRADCTMRVTVFAPGHETPASTPVPEPEPCVLVATLPAAAVGDRPLRVKSFRYRRVLPHVKHVGTFPLFLHRRMAVAAGFDDALFVDDAGTVSEGSLWNVVFDDGEGFVWPRAPALRGTCEQLLQTALAGAGVRQETRPVRLDGLAAMHGAYALNARGIRAIASIDGIGWTPAKARQSVLQAALDSTPWNPL